MWQRNGQVRARTILRKPHFQHCVHPASYSVHWPSSRGPCFVGRSPGSARASSPSPRHLHGWSHVIQRARSCMPKDRFGTRLLRSGMLSLARLCPPVSDLARTAGFPSPRTCWLVSNHRPERLTYRQPLQSVFEPHPLFGAARGMSLTVTEGPKTYCVQRGSLSEPVGEICVRHV